MDLYFVELAAVLELVYRMVSNTIARKGLWVRIPPAAFEASTDPYGPWLW